MKISRERLVQIIKEELNSAQPEFKTSDLQKTMSGGAAKQSMRTSGERLATDADITGKERQIIDQLKTMLETAASELDIATGNPYAILVRVYKILGQHIQKEKERQS